MASSVNVENRASPAYRLLKSIQDDSLQRSKAPEQDTSTSPAAYAVMHTTELREQILFELDNKTLLLAQRVSKAWKETIEKPAYQEKLFFTTGTTTSLVERSRMVHTEDAANPLLAKLSQKRPIAPAATFGSATFAAARQGFSYDGRSRLFSTDLSLDIRACSNLGRVKPSWMEMYILRAGFGIKNVEVWVRSESGVVEHVLRLEDGPYQGMKMGQLVKMALSRLSKKTADAARADRRLIAAWDGEIGGRAGYPSGCTMQ